MGERPRPSGSSGIARSELYPTLAAVALSGVDRQEIPLGSQFYRFTVPATQVSLDLNYTIFDFGARRGRIDTESARVLAANFSFNDVHRKLIFQVQQAYYRLLNASAQDTAARASLANAEAVQEAAEERLQNGLATLPDVLEARSATAQSQYDLQAVLGAEETARGDLATALGAPAATPIRVEPLINVAVNGDIMAYVPLLGASKPVIVLAPEDTSLQVGDRVILDVQKWGTEREPTTCEFSHLLGNIEDPSCDVKAVLKNSTLGPLFLSLLSIKLSSTVLKFPQKI